MTDPDQPRSPDPEALGRLLSQSCGSRYVVRDVRRAAVGYANETWVLDASPRRVVVKVQKSPSFVYQRDTAWEPEVLRSLAGTTVPVPRVIARGTGGDVLDDPWFAMEHVEGSGVPDEQLTGYAAEGWIADAPPARQTTIWSGFVECLSGLHTLPAATFGPSPRGGSHSAVLDYWETSLADVMPTRPRDNVQGQLLRWLRDHAPAEADDDPRPCMGDARLANVLVHGDRVTALLDWELAWVGNPRGDLGYHLFLDRRYAEAAGARLPGLPSAADTWLDWERLTGLEAGDTHYWEVFGAMVQTITATRVIRQKYDLDVDVVESANPFIPEVARWIGAPQ